MRWFILVVAAIWPGLTSEAQGDLFPLLQDGSIGACARMDANHNVVLQHVPVALLYQAGLDDKGAPQWTALWAVEGFDVVRCARSVSLAPRDVQTVLCLAGE